MSRWSLNMCFFCHHSILWCSHYESAEYLHVRCSNNCRQNRVFFLFSNTIYTIRMRWKKGVAHVSLHSRFPMGRVGLRKSMAKFAISSIIPRLFHLRCFSMFLQSLFRCCFRWFMHELTAWEPSRRFLDFSFAMFFDVFFPMLLSFETFSMFGLFLRCFDDFCDVSWVFFRCFVQFVSKAWISTWKKVFLRLNWLIFFPCEAYAVSTSSPPHMGRKSWIEMRHWHRHHHYFLTSSHVRVSHRSICHSHIVPIEHALSLSNAQSNVQNCTKKTTIQKSQWICEVYLL